MVPIHHSSASSRCLAHVQLSAFVAGFVEHPQAMEVITDSFGNYVAQRLIEAAGPQARLALGRLLAPAMLDLSKHQYGCRVVQHAIQVSAGIPSVRRAPTGAFF